MEHLVARPTTYRGIQMRSRLEARYAAWLDDRGLAWEYEPCAFGGRGGQYLPDFVIRYKDEPRPVYVEVRPTVERARSALSQMQVIWESEPLARLAVVIPDYEVLLSASIEAPWSQHRVRFWS